MLDPRSASGAVCPSARRGGAGRQQRGSVAEAGGGAARHTRAWSVGAPAIVADCRWLRFLPRPSWMKRSVTVTPGALWSASRHCFSVRKHEKRRPNHGLGASPQ